MNLEIKQLVSEDMDLLISMRMEVLSHVFARERQVMTEEKWQALAEENRRYYQQELANGGHIASVALLDGKIAGCGGLCLYKEMPSPDNPRGLCGYLMNIYTRKAYRQQGIARKICGWLIERAAERGAGKIYLETSTAARHLYQSIGFHDMKDYLKLDEAFFEKRNLL